MPLYDVRQDRLAFAQHGELISMFVSSCEIVIVIFDDGSLLMEHRSDIRLSGTGDMEDADNLLCNIFQHIIDFKGDETKIQNMCIIGDCSDDVKRGFQATLTDLKNDFMEEEEDLLDLPDGPIMAKLLRPMGLVEMAWNVEDNFKEKEKTK